MVGNFQCFLYVSFRVCRKYEEKDNAKRKKRKAKFPHVKEVKLNVGKFSIWGL